MENRVASTESSTVSSMAVGTPISNPRLYIAISFAEIK